MIKGVTKDKTLFPISVVAEVLGVHQRTLRIYDEQKLLVPSRSQKNRRLYSQDDIEKGQFIQYLTRDMGINLAGVQAIFSLLQRNSYPKENWLPEMQDIANEVGITPDIQCANRIKLSKRGRNKSIE